MITLLELKTKYQEAQAAQQREHAAKEQAREDHQQEILREFLPKVCEYLSEREGVAMAELLEFGRLEGDWHSSGELNYVMFYLELPEHHPMRIRLYTKNLPDNTRAEWIVDNYNSYQQFGSALLWASQLFERQQDEERQAAERQAAKQQREEDRAAEAEQRNHARQRLFEQLAKDPVALQLIKLFVQIQQDRDGLEGQIESLEESYANAEHWRDEELTAVQRKAEQAGREASDNNDRLRSLQYEVDDLKSELKKAQWQSNW